MNDNMEAREERRKRRKRNQISVYIVTVLLLLGLIAGIFFGAKLVLEKVKNYNTKNEIEESQNIMEEVVVVPTEEPTVLPTEEPDVLGELADGIISNMTLEEKVANLFMITPEALTGYNQVVKAGPSTKEALEKYAVGGIIYFSKNLQTEEQVQEMLSNTIQYSKYVPFIAIDEEGGAVSRVASSDLEATKFEDLNVLGETMTSEEAIQLGDTIGAYLATYGFNLDLAPVADVLTNSDSPLANRILNSDSEIVANLSSSIVTGIQGQSISACMKHFPGIGSVDVDSHDILPTTDRTLDEMRNEEFIPFIAGIEAGVDMIMVGHIATPQITNNSVPASLSKVMVTDILRNEFGFEGIIITDSLQMVAITKDYTSAEAAIGAIEAGVDMLLMPKDFEEAYQAILDAVDNGTITEERIDESLHRILCVKYKYTELANN